MKKKLKFPNLPVSPTYTITLRYHVKRNHLAHVLMLAESDFINEWISACFVVSNFDLHNK